MPNERKEPAAGKPRAVVLLHKEGAEDEPLEIDVDVTVTCECGTSSTERKEIYKERDDAHVMCAGCGAVYRVDVSTVIVFTAQPTMESGSVLGGPHAE
jgi:hypothetical protein